MSRFTLRPDQAKVKAEIYASWAAGNKYTLACAATGWGKTVLFTDVIADERDACCVIAHRHELVGQISMALARNGVRHRIIGAPALATECTQAHMEEVNTNYVDPNSRVAVASVDTLIRKDGPEWQPWFDSVKTWVMDECFPPGTMVSGRAIETIQVGDYVEAFNEQTQTIESRRVERLFKNPAPEYMVRIVAAHHVLECTLGHPFFTKRGWVDAGDLRQDDEVLEYEMHAVRGRSDRPETTPDLHPWEARSDILLESLRLGLSDGYRKEAQAEGVAPCRLHDMRETCGFERAPPQLLGEHGASILQPRMLKQIQVNPIIGNNEQDQQRACIGQDDGQQSNGEPGDARQNVEHVARDGAPAEGARGQRKAANGCGNGTFCVNRGFGFCSATCDCNGKDSGQRIPAMLQAGLGALGAENSSRSGWREPQRPAATGCEEGRALNWVGVDSVAIFKRPNIDSADCRIEYDYVYNIEVEGLHTYIANGIVVHNCHHLLKHNKWGDAVAKFRYARGLGVTAETERADGYGLGAQNDGIFQDIVLAPTMRDVINMGNLTDYRVFVPPNDLDLSQVNVTASGDYSQKASAKAHKASHITGDAIKHYLKLAPGKLGILFAVDIEDAIDKAQAFRDAGVPSEVVTSKTPSFVRRDILRKFRDRKILMLVNVDLFGEGFDLPAIEVVIMCRATQSFNLYKQQFGRALRKMGGKQWAIIIDHVGNVLRHGLPDQLRTQSLGRPVPKAKREPDEDVMLMTYCGECTQAYERIKACCPYCGHGKIPTSRSAPEYVDGNLYELDQETLAKMRGDAEAVMNPANVKVPFNADAIIARGCHNRFMRGVDAQNDLRNTIALWAGYQKDHKGRSDAEIYKLFYLTYGVDVLSAQALKQKDAAELNEKLTAKLLSRGVTKLLTA